MSMCQCGCGAPAPIAKLTNRRYGWRAGQPVRFIAGHNQRKAKIAAYRLVRRPDHPRANPVGYVLEHVLIAEQALGRFLPAGVEVHHVDEVKSNNAPSNLVICQDREYHDLLHVRARVRKAGGDPNTQRLCYECRQPKALSEFNKSRSNKNGGVCGRCRECSRIAWKRYAADS